MPFLAINGWTISVSAQSGAESPEVIGDSARAFDGTLTSQIRAHKRAWKLKTIPLIQEDAFALRDLLLGKGHVWSYDSTLYSSKGLATVMAAGAASYAASVYGNGLNVLSASGHVVTIATADILAKGSFTIELIHTPGEDPAHGDVRVLLDIYIDANNYYRICEDAAGKPYAVINAAGTPVSTAHASDVAMANGVASHLAMRIDGTHLAFFVAGVQSAGGDVDYVEPTGTLPANLYLGSNAASGAYPNGRYDNLRISPTVRSDSEIAGAYTQAIAHAAAPRLNVSGDIVSRAAANPLTCKAEVGDIDFVPLGTGSTYCAVDFTLLEV